MPRNARNVAERETIILMLSEEITFNVKSEICVVQMLRLHTQDMENKVKNVMPIMNETGAEKLSFKASVTFTFPQSLK